MKRKLDIAKLVRPNVRELKAYEAKEVPCRVKLDANESPYDLKLMKGIKTNRYPDPEALDLRKAFSKSMGLKASNVLVGNGSDELIYYLVTTFGGPVLYHTPTFVMYGIISTALGEKTVEVPLDGSFNIDLDTTLRAMRREKPRIVFMVSPNNPTGNCMNEERMHAVLDAARGIVVVDEAYLPFAGGKGFLPYLKEYGNLFVMKTLSKVGLAALRVGFLVGGEEILGEVNKVRLPFNLNSVSQALALKAVKDKKGIRDAVRAVVSERRRLAREMSRIGGIDVYPSEANFILIKVAEAGKVHAGLLKRGVLVRNLGGILDGCLRVTVGTKTENDIFLSALKETIKKPG